MQNGTKDTDQEIQNQSFDPTFQVLSVELMGWDAVNNVLRRVQCDSTGRIIVSDD